LFSLARFSRSKFSGAHPQRHKAQQAPCHQPGAQEEDHDVAALDLILRLNHCRSEHHAQRTQKSVARGEHDHERGGKYIAVAERSANHTPVDVAQQKEREENQPGQAPEQQTAPSE